MKGSFPPASLPTSPFPQSTAARHEPPPYHQTRSLCSRARVCVIAVASRSVGSRRNRRFLPVSEGMGFARGTYGKGMGGIRG